MRLRGLRILARMIVRAHLASLIEQDAETNGSKSVPTPSGDDSLTERDRAG